MRLTEWPRMPFLNEEVKEWIALELQSLGIEDLAVYALEAGQEGDERRVMVATEVGLLDHRYAPFGSSARYRLAMLMYPWQVLRGVEQRHAPERGSGGGPAAGVRPHVSAPGPRRGGWLSQASEGDGRRTRRSTHRRKHRLPGSAAQAR